MADSDNNYYSKRNPLGPYAGATRPNAPAPKPSDYIAGQSTKANLKQWADRATRNSNPTRDQNRK
jgi:hypothetical protein